jgi:hypothetical protein
MTTLIDLLLGTLATLGSVLIGWAAAWLLTVPRWGQSTGAQATMALLTVLVVPVPLILVLVFYPAARVPFVALVVVLTGIVVIKSLLNRRKPALPPPGKGSSLAEDLEYLCGGSKAAWELTHKTGLGETIRLVFQKAEENGGEASGAVQVSEGIVAGFGFTVEYQNDGRSIRANGAAFASSTSVPLLPYKLGKDVLWLDGGNALGLYELKGEWKRVQ